MNIHTEKCVYIIKYYLFQVNNKNILKLYYQENIPCNEYNRSKEEENKNCILS